MVPGDVVALAPLSTMAARAGVRSVIPLTAREGTSSLSEDSHDGQAPQTDPHHRREALSEPAPRTFCRSCWNAALIHVAEQLDDGEDGTMSRADLARLLREQCIP